MFDWLMGADWFRRKDQSVVGAAGIATRHRRDPKVYISYRRQDSVGQAGRLYDLLAQKGGLPRDTNQNKTRAAQSDA